MPECLDDAALRRWCGTAWRRCAGTSGRADELNAALFSTEWRPDEIVTCVVGPDGSMELGRLDGRYVSIEVAGG